jgi:hypothetical protein
MTVAFKREFGPIDSGVRVTLLSPMGSYQQDSLISRHGCMFVDDKLCFSVVRFARRSQIETYSELDHVGSAEVRLLSAALMAAKSYYVTIRPYPAYSLTLSMPPGTRIATSQTRERLSGMLVRDLKREMGSSRFFSESFHAPPVLGGKQYDTLQDLDHTRFHALLEGIALGDKLLIRGLGALLKANMLLRFWEFAEAAGMQLYVALESSFRLALRALREQGIQDPSNVDAGNFIHKAFGVPTPAEGYFVEDYEKRIMTLHPESRFGTWAHAPLYADDVYELNENLKNLFGFLILGTIPSYHLAP